MPRNWIIAIGGGLISAIASLAFLGGVPGALLLAYLAPLPLMMAGLAFGPAAAAVASVAGALAAGAVGSTAAVALFAVIHGLPAWMTVRLALINRPAEKTGRQQGGTIGEGADDTVWYPAGHVLAWLTALGGGFFLISVLFIAGGAGEFKGAVANYLNQVLTMLAPALPKESRAQVLAMITPLFPALVGATWLVVTAVNGALAQGILGRLGRALRPSPSYRNLSLPHWLSWLLVGAAAMALMGPLMGMREMEYVGRNLAVISAVPFFFLGVAVLRSLVKGQMFVMVVIISLYLFFMIPGLASLLVTAIGLTERWIGLRRFFPSRTGVS
jgi:hypothetical protein